jgi:hypothetical protein
MNHQYKTRKGTSQKEIFRYLELNTLKRMSHEMKVNWTFAVCAGG